MTSAAELTKHDRTITPEQASDLLNVSQITIYRWLRAGKIPGVKIGRQWRLPADIVDQLLDSQGEH